MFMEEKDRPMLNHHGADPLYQQLAAYLRQAIVDGKYPVGTRLPTEEQLTKEADVSQGTVKQAYALLRQEGLLKTVRGSGSYVAGTVDYTTSDPADMLDSFFAEAFRRGTPARTVYQLFFRQLENFYAEDQTICAALLDCNWETLHVVARQLEQIPGLRIIPYQENELLLKYNMVIHPECALIITTQMHYQAILRYAGGLRLRIEAIAMRESEHTVAALSRLAAGSSLCLIYRSEEFKKTVLYALSSLRLYTVICVQEDDLTAIEQYAAAGTPLLVPPDYMEYTGANALQIIERAKKAGVTVIPFDYEVEQGSLLHLRQKIQSLQRRS